MSIDWYNAKIEGLEADNRALHAKLEAAQERGEKYFWAISEAFGMQGDVDHQVSWMKMRRKEDIEQIAQLQARITQLEGALKLCISEIMQNMGLRNEYQDFDTALQHAQQALGENPVK
jgi:chromosome segregation ATPase